MNEEMNRTLRFLLWKEKTWKEWAFLKEVAACKTDEYENPTHEHAEGL